MYQDIDYYLKSIFYERPDNPAKLLSDLFKIQNITDIKVIKIKEQHPKIIIPDFVIKFKIENQYYLLNIEFQTKLNKESILKTVMYNILIKQEYKLPVLSMILSIDKRYSKNKSVFYYKVKENIEINNKKRLDFIKLEVIVINLLNEEIKELVKKRDYLGLIELIESYTSDYNINKLKEMIDLVEERAKKGIYKEKEEILLKIIIGLMYLRRSKISKEEILSMLRIDKKEKEKIKKMYKDNPLIQYIAEAILEEEKKRYKEELEKHKEELEKHKEELEKHKQEKKKYQEKLEQKEEELKQLKINALKETVYSLLKVKLKQKWTEFLIKIERINDEHELIKLKEILEEDIPYNELYKIINDFFNN